MATEIGIDTSYPITIPSGADNADIQSALRLISYGIPGTPTSNNQITSNSIFGKMSLLAPKAAPAFTGSGSITGDFSIGGNLTVSGTLNRLVGSSSIFEDKNIILNGDTSTPSTDVLADGSGLSVNGLTVKNFTFSNGIGWNSSENLNLVTGKTFKINGTDVLSSNAVLGILGTNIAKKDSANAFTGPNTFSGATQTINGLTIATNGYISKSLVSNEWDGVTVYAPGQDVSYQVTSSSHLDYTLKGSFSDPGNPGYYFYNWGEIIRLSISPGSLVVGDTLNLTLGQYSSYVGSFTATITSISQTYIDVSSNGSIYQTYGNAAVPPYYSYAGYGGAAVDSQFDGINGQRPSVQYWNVGGTDIANIDRFGNFTVIGNSVAASFKDTGKTYHTNASVPYFNIGLSSSTDKVFSVTTLQSPWQNITTSGNATATTISKWYATGFTNSNVSGNMPYSLSNGVGTVTVSQSGVYNISASLTMGESVVGNLIGLFIIDTNGTVNLPFAVSGGASSGSTVNISSVKHLSSGQKIGLAVYNGNATSAATDLSVTATNYTSVKLSGFLIG